MDKNVLDRGETTLVFITKSKCFTFCANIEDDTKRCDFTKQMLLMFFKFKRENKNTDILRYSGKLKKNIEKFIDENSEHEELLKIKHTLKDGEYFFVYPLSINLGQLEQLKLIDKIARLNNEESPALAEQYSEILKYYTVDFFSGDESRWIGESEKKRRICRFCGKSEPDTSFKMKAHALSEFLGNKQIILNEECDQCNTWFGKELEPDFQEWIKSILVFGKISGKTGIPKIKDSEKIIQCNQNKELHIEFNKPIRTLKDIFSFSIHTGQKVIPQNIYRILCKYALSVVNTDDVRDYKETIRWIVKTNVWEKLPNIKVSKLNQYFSEYSKHSKLKVFTKKCNLVNIPNLWATLDVGYITFLYIVPKTKEEAVFFCNSNNFDIFLKLLNIDSSNWENYDLSSEKKYSINRKYSFKLNNKIKNTFKELK